jgi:hypothetical protein
MHITSTNKLLQLLTNQELYEYHIMCTHIKDGTRFMHVLNNEETLWEVIGGTTLWRIISNLSERPGMTSSASKIAIIVIASKPPPH